MTGPRRQKVELRAELLARRRGFTADQLAAVGRALAAAAGPLLRDARAVASYASVGTEPPTSALHALLGPDVRLMLPVLLPDGDLDWAEAGGPLPTVRGLLEPSGPRRGVDAVAETDVVIVPALAVDLAGRRLGRGGGSYDRALPRARGLVVALVHDGELVEALPEEGHDVRVAAVVTPSRGLVRLAGGMGP